MSLSTSVVTAMRTQSMDNDEYDAWCHIRSLVDAMCWEAVLLPALAEPYSEAMGAGEYDGDDVEFTRADGNCICEPCGREYWRHPLAGPLSDIGQQWLHELCDGSLVKL